MSAAKSFAANSRRHLTKSSNMSAKPSNACADALQIAGRLADAGGMILLPIAQEPMAVATDRDQFVIEGLARDVMKLQRQRDRRSRRRGTADCSYPGVRAPAAGGARGSIHAGSCVNLLK